MIGLNFVSYSKLRIINDELRRSWKKISEEISVAETLLIAIDGFNFFGSVIRDIFQLYWKIRKRFVLVNKKTSINIKVHNIRYCVIVNKVSKTIIILTIKCTAQNYGHYDILNRWHAPNLLYQL